MKIWINKCVEEERIEGFKNSIDFNINIPGKGGILTSDIRKGWYHKLGVQGVSSICEDLYIIALSVFATDKRVPRAITSDGWTYSINRTDEIIGKITLKLTDVTDVDMSTSTQIY